MRRSTVNDVASALGLVGLITFFVVGLYAAFQQGFWPTVLVVVGLTACVGAVALDIVYPPERGGEWEYHLDTDDKVPPPGKAA